MGDLVQFPLDRARHAGHSAPDESTFFFDVASPLSYLVAERVERQLGDVEWVPVDGSALLPTDPVELDRLRRRAEERAEDLRLPLVWPDQFPLRAPRALRVAAFACELGGGPAFALAASRLAFCGGFALDDPEVITEAAAAAALPLRPCLEAARETWRDEQLTETAEAIREAGLDELPAFVADGRWLSGEDGLSTGKPATTRLEAPARRRMRPVAPAG